MTFDNDLSLSSSSMSEYEKLRAKNISKNNARLRSLGLISSLEEQRSNAAALGEDDKAITTSTTTTTIGNEKTVLAQPRPSSSSITKKRKSRVVDGEASRKSLRLQGINVVVDSSTKTTMIEEERIERVKECREMRLRSAQVVFEAGLEVAAKENPTATYDHCLMRVRSMSEKGLGNRIKAIERSVGKHCVVKMAIFKSCLQDEGLWTLADLAAESLERLKGLVSPPP